MEAGFSEVRQEMEVGFADVRQTLTEYHSAVLGHGMLITELETRIRRIERHLYDLHALGGLHMRTQHRALRMHALAHALTGDRH